MMMHAVLAVIALIIAANLLVLATLALRFRHETTQARLVRVDAGARRTSR
ncbi:hypothetical protein [Aeromicrobium sp. Root495]|nr:hypothetical protein [Aeromicrobium sp. Root495]